jgi:hypothetical protein
MCRISRGSDDVGSLGRLLAEFVDTALQPIDLFTQRADVGIGHEMASGL